MIVLTFSIVFECIRFSAMPTFRSNRFGYAHFSAFSFSICFSAMALFGYAHSAKPAFLCNVFGHAHFLFNSFFGYALFRLCPLLFFNFVFRSFRPCMPIAQMRLAVRDGFSMFSWHLRLFPPTSIMYF